LNDYIIYEDEYKLCPKIFRGETLCFVGGGGNGGSGSTWRPNVNINGDLSWAINNSVTPPASVNIKGAKGDAGKSAYQLWIDAGNTGTIGDFLDSLKGQDGVGGTGTNSIALTNKTLNGTSNTTITIPSSNIFSLYGNIDVGAVIYDNAGSVGIITAVDSNTNTYDVTIVAIATGGNISIGNYDYNYEFIEGDFESYENSLKTYKLRKTSGDSDWINPDGNIEVDKRGLYIFSIFSNSDYNPGYVDASIALERLSDNVRLSYSSSASYDSELSPLNFIGELDTDDEYIVSSKNGTILLDNRITWKLLLISGYGPFWEEA
jgi:hypothetical protein